MIKELSIKNYKCFPELNLQLKKLNILAGANAAGKSSVIQAFLLSYFSHFKCFSLDLPRKRFIDQLYFSRFFKRFMI